MIEQIVAILAVLGFILTMFKIRRVMSIFKIFDLKIVYMFLIPILLIILGITLSINEVYKINHVLLQLTSEYNRSNLYEYNFNELTQGEKIRGYFKAKDNYLGIASVRFWNFYRLNDDYVIFRIREQGQPDWFYQNQHKVDQFLANGLFTFGFPIINDSVGKTYEFEVESTSGSRGNAIGLSEIEPVLTATYKYPRSIVLSSPKHVLNFVARKAYQLLFMPRFMGSAFIYFLPLIIYLLFHRLRYLTYKQTKLYNINNVSSLNQISSFIINDPRASYYISIILLIGALIIDIFWVQSNDLTIIVLLALWVFIVKSYKLLLKNTYQMAIILFIIAFVTWYSGNANGRFISERAMAWSFLFILTSIIQMIISFEKSST